VSGLPTDRFVHEGFVPKKGKKGYLQGLALEKRTLVFFESPHRLGQTLLDMAEAMGADRPACVVRELTKMFEEVAWGTLSELATRFSGVVKGEIVIVVGGALNVEGDLDGALRDVRARVSQGEQLSVACATVSKMHGLSKRELYQAALSQSP
jgi:16S rRNA (cytidine1402-2'-O)-methyltransferase